MTPKIHRRTFAHLLAGGLLTGSLLFYSPVHALAQPQDPSRILKSGDLVGMLGDSITEQKAYTVNIAAYLALCQPELKVGTMQFGWSGDTATGVLGRLEHDVLPFAPTVVTTCYGMNDGGYSAITPAKKEGYKKALTAIVAKLKAAGVRRIILGSPGAVDSDTFTNNIMKGIEASTYNECLAALGQGAKEVAAETGVEYVDVHTPMMEAMAKAKAKYGPKYHVAGKDGFHPSFNGHMVMAYAFLKALGCTGDIGTITLDARAGTAAGSPGHTVLAATPTSVEVRSTRYPFCTYGAPEDPGSTRGIIEFFPFNQDLNRYMLVVKNLPGASAKVTWGANSKVFTAEELGKGINLAAEFLDNPFSPHFSGLFGYFQGQENQETRAVKTLQRSLVEWEKEFPEANSDGQVATKRLTSLLVEKTKAQREKNLTVLKPVKHTIQIEVQP